MGALQRGGRRRRGRPRAWGVAACVAVCAVLLGGCGRIPTPADAIVAPAGSALVNPRGPRVPWRWRTPGELLGVEPVVAARGGSFAVDTVTRSGTPTVLWFDGRGRELAQYPDAVVAALSPGGRHLLLLRSPGSSGHPFLFLAGPGGRVAWSLLLHHPMSAAAFAPGGRAIVYATLGRRRGTLREVGLGGRMRWSVAQRVETLAFSPRGHTLGVVSPGGVGEDSRTGAPLWRRAIGPHAGWAVAVNPGGSMWLLAPDRGLLLRYGRTGAVRVRMDLSGSALVPGRASSVLVSATEEVTRVSPSGRILARVEGNFVQGVQRIAGRARILWNHSQIPNRAPALTVTDDLGRILWSVDPGQAIRSAWLDPGARAVLVWGADRRLYSYPLTLHAPRYAQARLVPALWTFRDRPRRLRLFTSAAGAPVVIAYGGARRGGALAFGGFLVAAPGGTPLWRRDLPGVTDIEVATDGEILVAWGATRLTLYRNDGGILWSRALPGPLREMAMSPGGSYVVGLFAVGSREELVEWSSGGRTLTTWVVPKDSVGQAVVEAGTGRVAAAVRTGPRWQVVLLDARGHLLDRWRFGARPRLFFPARGPGPVIAVGGQRPRVMAVGPDLAFAWSHRFTSPARPRQVLEPGPGQVAVLWEANLPRVPGTAPAIVDVLTSLSMTTGRLAWTHTFADRPARLVTRPGGAGILAEMTEDVRPPTPGELQAAVRVEQLNPRGGGRRQYSVPSGIRSLGAGPDGLVYLVDGMERARAARLGGGSP